MRKIFFKKDWQDIQTFLKENNEVVLNDNYKGFKIECVYHPITSSDFLKLHCPVDLVITDGFGYKYSRKFLFGGDYDSDYAVIVDFFSEFEKQYIEGTAKTIEEVYEDNKLLFESNKQKEEEKHLQEFDNYIATGDENLFADCLEYWEDKKNRNEIIKRFLTNEVNKYAHSQLKIAFVLKTVYDEKLYQIDGYKNIYDYAYDNYNIARGTCSNWLKVVDNFGVLNKQTGFYGLDNKLQDFSITQLILIRGLTIEQIQAANITPDMSTREIKQVVKDELNLKHIATDVSVNTDNLIDNPDSEDELYGDAVKADIISDSSNQSVGYDIKSSITPPVSEKSDNSDKDVKEDSKETVKEIEKPKMKLGLKGGFDLTTSQINMLNSLLNKYKGKEVDICIYVN